MTSLHQKYVTRQASQSVVWGACPVSAGCSQVTVLHLWNTPNTSQLRPSHVNSQHHFPVLTLFFCPHSSLPGSHLTLVGRTHSEHTSQIHQGHGPEKLECHWTPDRTGSQTGSEQGPSNQYFHTATRKQNMHFVNSLKRKGLDFWKCKNGSPPPKKSKNKKTGIVTI